MNWFIKVVVCTLFIGQAIADANSPQSPEPSSFSRIAVVNVSTLLNQAPQAKEAVVDLKKEFGTIETELENEERAIKDQEYQLQRALGLSEEERLQQKRDLRSRKRSHRRASEDFRDDLRSAREAALNKVQSEVFSAIDEVRHSNDIDVVLKESDFISASARIDITNLVLQYLKQKHALEQPQVTTVPPTNSKE